MIFYEFPTSERIRTLLRLESAFSTLAHFIGQDTSDDHHAAIMMLFDLAEIGARGDIKSEFLQELERQRVRLEGLRDNPAIAEDTLENTLDNIEHIHDQQLELTSRFGNEIREPVLFLPELDDEECEALLDTLNDEIAKKYEVRLRVMDEQLKKEGTLNTAAAAKYIADVNLANTELAKNAEENHTEKFPADLAELAD